MAQRRILEMFEKDPAGSHLYARLLGEAAIKDRTVTACGQLVDLKRGQLVFGRAQWADKTGITENVIRRIMKQLEQVGEIHQLNRVKFSIVSVLSMMAMPTEHQQNSSESPADPHSKNRGQGKEKREGTDKALVAGAPKKVAQVLDWSPLNLTPEHQEAVKAIRAKHGKKGAISQRVINILGKEFEQARSGGLSDEQIIGEWDTRGWLGLKAEWLHKSGRQGPARLTAAQQRIADNDAMFARFLGTETPHQQQGGHTYDHQ
ncbi:hypothetical protein OB931_09530 [Aeromonas media]|uniref:hypothetical protein n=1 Tax=Aeromonas media TaxID=651 RepID=UPI0024C0F09D|nr:hypothetical protein [Aeromonas media]MDM5076615.1 hypothetical protein [Aeromonas media]